VPHSQQPAYGPYHKLDQSSPHVPIPLPKDPSHLRLGLPSGFPPSGLPSKTLYAPILISIHSTCPAHPILLDLITQTIYRTTQITTEQHKYKLFHVSLYLCCSMYCLCVNVYCHRVTAQLQLINISIYQT
jgi:hypothetical protein